MALGWRGRTPWTTPTNGGSHRAASSRNLGEIVARSQPSTDSISAGDQKAPRTSETTATLSKATSPVNTYSYCTQKRPGRRLGVCENSHWVPLRQMSTRRVGLRAEAQQFQQRRGARSGREDIQTSQQKYS
ncbi:hypothetical protein N7513_000003 [Penicillium frequentans]|nr:hypothetical protein N7513_000003 [Penicillium glabrum]